MATGTKSLGKSVLIRERQRMNENENENKNGYGSGNKNENEVDIIYSTSMNESEEVATGKEDIIYSTSIETRERLKEDINLNLNQNQNQNNNNSNNNSNNNNNASACRLVRDCHAEIIARRGFLRWLQMHIRSLQQAIATATRIALNLKKTSKAEEMSKSKSKSKSLEADSDSYYCDYDISPYFNVCSISSSAGSDSGANVTEGTTVIGLINECVDWRDIEFRLELKSSCSLHLYTSSQPCGNAAIKRWAKGGNNTMGGTRMNIHRLLLCYI